MHGWHPRQHQKCFLANLNQEQDFIPTISLLLLLLWPVVEAPAKKLLEGERHQISNQELSSKGRQTNLKTLKISTNNEAKLFRAF